MAGVTLPKAAAAELGRLHRERAVAEQRLSDYLRGLLDALEVRPEDVAGFDDRTGELLLREDEEATNA